VIGVSTAISVQGQSPSDDVDVYRLALRAAVTADRLSEGRLALMSETATDVADSVRWHEQVLKDPHERARLTKYAKPETVEAFLAAGATLSPLPRELASREFALVDAKHLKAERAAVGTWRGLASRHRVVHGRIVSVSSIGFDAVRSQALVWVKFTCGILCGDSKFVLLERGPTGWQVINVDTHWVY
jgi:hypothetical protein